MAHFRGEGGPSVGNVDRGAAALLETTPVQGEADRGTRSEASATRERIKAQTVLEVIETPRGTIRKITFKESREAIEVGSFEEAIEKAGAEIDARVEVRFGKDGKVPMHKHSPDHSTEEVEGGATRMLEVVNKALVEAYGSVDRARKDPAYSSPEQIGLTRLMAKVHDSVQNHILIKDPNGHQIMQRYRGAEGLDPSEQSGDPKAGNRAPTLVQEMADHKLGGNEKDSADELVEHLKRYRYPDGSTVFTKEQLAAVRPNVAATYPNFRFSPDTGLKVYQPYLDRSINPELTIAGVAIAHADLRVLLAQDSSKGFENGGDAELRESKPWIGALVKNDLRKADPKEIRQAVKEALSWLDDQIGFAKWQKVLVTESIDTDAAIHKSLFAENIQRSLREFFKLGQGDSFDKNIERCKIRAMSIRGTYQDLIDPAVELNEANRSRALRLLTEEVRCVD